MDMAVYPPSYGVQINDNIRETEAARLTSRSGSTAPQTPPAGPAFHTANSGSAYMPQLEQQHSTHHSSMSDSDFDNFQGSSAHPSQTQPQQAPVAFPPAFPHQEQQGSFSTDWHNSLASTSAPSGSTQNQFHPHSAELWSQAWQQNGDFSTAYHSHATHQPAASNALLAQSYLPAQRSATDHRSQELGPVTGSWEAGHAEAIRENGSEDDDGFGDFAEAPPSPHKVANNHQQLIPVSDRQVTGPALDTAAMSNANADVV